MPLNSLPAIALATAGWKLSSLPAVALAKAGWGFSFYLCRLQPIFQWVVRCSKLSVRRSTF